MKFANDQKLDAEHGGAIQEFPMLKILGPHKMSAHPLSTSNIQISPNSTKLPQFCSQTSPILISQYSNFSIIYAYITWNIINYLILILIGIMCSLVLQLWCTWLNTQILNSYKLLEENINSKQEINITNRLGDGIFLFELEEDECLLMY